MTPSKLKIRFEDVCFYFDGVERDRMDASGVSRKSAEILALREKLITLPEDGFESVISTVKSLVRDLRPFSPENSGRDHRKGRGEGAAQHLFEQTNAQRGAVQSVERVS